MKKILCMSMAVGLMAAVAEAGIVQYIRVEGNTRVEKDTILFEIPYKKGDKYNETIADDILKALNRTGYFEDVQVEVLNDGVVIHVRENPIINKIAYEGMKHGIRETVNEMVKLKSRQVLSKAVIQEAQQTILEIYRRSGHLSAKVTPKIVRLSQNRVDVVFEIQEGKTAYVRKINFIGNKHFVSPVLQEVIKTHKKQWFHVPFLGGTQNKVYDPDRFVEDQKALAAFYADMGYADFNIVSASAELTPDKESFFLTFYLQEGKQYKIGNVSVDSHIAKLDGKILKDAVMVREGQIYSKSLIDVCKDVLESLASARGYPFAIVRPRLVKHADTQKVDIEFVIDDGPKVFIERIDIKGNRHTRDKVIRRELGFDEGDAFLQQSLKRAEQKVEALDFFKTARIQVAQGTTPNGVTLTTNVEEKRTGEIFAQFGYSTIDHATINAHLHEPNFRGKAQTFGIDVLYSKKELTCSVDFTEPRFLNHALTGSLGLEHVRSKRSFGTIRTDTGIIPSLSYMLLPRVRQSWSYRFHRQDLESDSKRLEKLHEKLNESPKRSDIPWHQWLETDAGKEQLKFVSTEDELKTYWGSELGHAISYDRRNQRLLPSQGYRLGWSTNFAGVGGSIKFCRNTWSASWHHRVIKSVIFNLRGSFSHITSVGGKDLRVLDALYIGGESLRGFDFQGISPVRGFPKKRFVEALHSFIEADQAQLSETDKKFLADNASDIEAIFVEHKHDVTMYRSFLRIFEKAVLNNQKDAIFMKRLMDVQGRKVGGTLAWFGTAEIVFPMPFLPNDVQMFGSLFADAGSCWRSLRSKEYGDILLDTHNIRTSVGMSVAWNSPFGMLSVGYAWPIKKEPYDVQQKFLFGYGLKLD